MEFKALQVVNSRTFDDLYEFEKSYPILRSVSVGEVIDRAASDIISLIELIMLVSNGDANYIEHPLSDKPDYAFKLSYSDLIFDDKRSYDSVSLEACGCSTIESLIENLSEVGRPGHVYQYNFMGFNIGLTFKLESHENYGDGHEMLEVIKVSFLIDGKHEKDILIQCNGIYSSWDSSIWNEVYFVEPYEVVETRYRLRGAVIDGK